MKLQKLSHLFHIKSGGTPSRHKPEYYGGQIPWAKIGDIESAENGVIEKTEEYITLEGLESIRNRIFSKGTLLLAMYGSVGKVAFTGTEMSTNQAILGLEPKDENLVRPKYVYYWLKSNKNKLGGLARGGILKNLSATIVKEIQIPLPPLDDQKRIAYLLGKVEGLIAQRKQHLQHLDDLLKSIFLEMFGDPVRNEKGWETKTLGKLASSFKYGTNVKSRNDASNGIPVLRIPNIIGGKLDLTDIKYSNLDEVELEKTQLIEGDLLLVRTNGNPEYIGRSAVFDITEDIYAYASYLIRVRFEGVDTIRPDFLNFVINFPSYRSSLVTRAKTTAGNYNINTASLKTLIIPLPPIELQNQFTIIVEKVEGIKSRYQQSLIDLETLYSALSQKAFKGELDLSRVPLPLDDPEAIAADPLATHEPPQTADTFHLPAPSDLATLNSPEGRTALLDNWLTLWLERLNNTPFSTQPFIDAAQQRLWELAEEDALELGAADYDYVRLWISESLERRHLAQTYNDDKNRVQLKAVSHR